MTTWLRRGVGLVVVVLSVLPLHRVLAPDRTGPWGAQAVNQAELSWSVTVWGSLVIALIAVVGAILGRRRRSGGGQPGEKQGHALRVGRGLTWIPERLTGPDGRGFSWGIAAFAGGLALLLATAVYGRLLTNVDEMTALIHARYLAAGSAGGHLGGAAQAWLVPNMLVVDSGWVSQYPPGHLFLLAAFSALGVWWLLGPFSFALTVGLFSASVERLLPDRRLEVRVAAVLLAVNPFMLLVAGGALSHVTAAAAGAAALYAAVRGAEGHWRWAFAAGMAMGLMVVIRPWTGLIIGPVLTVGVWLALGGWRLALRRLGPWVAGGIPCAVVLFAYNDALFGSPTTLGYEVLYGPAHGLGFHVDPWAFHYGLREALGYTASDMLQVGARLLELPVSVTLVAGAYLLLAPRISGVVAVAGAWAVAPVVGNALYWFHQPRMLYESAPAWILLAVLGVSAILRGSREKVRIGVLWAVGAAVLIGVIAFAPARFAGHRWSDETLSRTTLRDPDAQGALVFVHASWNERVSALLQASGMRNDSIQAVVRRNDTCTLSRYAWARVRTRVEAESEAAEARAVGPLPTIDLEQTSERPASLTPVRGPSGSTLLQDRGGVWPAECLREAEADRFGTVALAPLLWQGDLPGLEEGRPLFVRDYGPEGNRTLLERYRDRAALVFMYRPDGGAPGLVPYEEAMRVLWGDPRPE